MSIIEGKTTHDNPDNERINALVNTIGPAIDGLYVLDAMSVISTLLVDVIINSSDTVDAAEQMIDDLVGPLKENIRANWERMTNIRKRG
jgi:hypothetical protein